MLGVACLSMSREGILMFEMRNDPLFEFCKAFAIFMSFGWRGVNVEARHAAILRSYC